MIVQAKGQLRVNDLYRKSSAVGAKTLENYCKTGLYNGHMHLQASSSVDTHTRSDYLPNGLKVVVCEVHTAPLVSVWCWYRVGSGDESAGRTGVSHWVEHMNFKGTANIPREQMKGIVERFGGMWNGYTWIDQTTYLETAGRAALDQMLFIEAERMAYGLYEPAECESERTVIISELQGGENDPDQLLDTEVTATAFRAHPYRHPTIGWLDDLRSMTPRRPLRPLPSLLHSKQRHARRGRRCRCETMCFAARRGTSRRSSGEVRCRDRVRVTETAADRRAAGRHRAGRDDRLCEGGVSRPCRNGA